MNWYDNELCEICKAHWNHIDAVWNRDYYVINQHCIDLRRNQEARKHKNTKPKSTVF